MRPLQRFCTSVLFLLLAALPACVAARTPIVGRFDRPYEPHLNAPPVSVLFVFRHETQWHGFDAIPKLQTVAVKDFQNLFGDALREISNIGRYDTFTVLPNDVNDPQRRDALAAAKAAMDYVVEIDLAEESSFRQQCFSGTVSLLTLAIIPMPYDFDYTVRARVFDKGGRKVAALQRKGTLTSWVELFLVFAYPFYPFEGKREEIYSESLHDLFGQLETEKVLK